MGWDAWIRGGAGGPQGPGGVEVLPSLYAADFLRLGVQVEALLAAGCTAFHFDVGDGHFIPPVTIGPVVLRALEPLVHGAGGVLDCHLMVDNPERHFEEIAASGGDTVSFHHEVCSDPAATAAAARAHGLVPGLAFNPATAVTAAARAALAADVEFVLCMSIVPGYSGQPFLPESVQRVAELRRLLPAAIPIQVDGGVGAGNVAALREAGASLLVAGSAVFARSDPAEAWRELAAAAEAVGAPA